jgi:carboxyl-terminal processing protease
MVNKKLGILFLMSVILAFFAGFYAQRIIPFSPQTNSGDMFDYIIQSFENYYYYDLDDDEIHQAFIATMEASINKIAELNNDPYTRLVATPLASGPFDDEKFVGIGVSFVFEARDLRVGYVYPQGAAHQKIYPNDLIVGIKNGDEDVYFKDLNTVNDVLLLLSGEVDETKNFLILNPDGEEDVVSITYKEILTPTAYSLNLGEPNIAYIKIDRFSGASDGTAGTAQVFQNTLNELEATLLSGEGKTLILDLRNNPGGALTALHNQGVSSVLPGITQQLLTQNVEAPLFTMIPKTGTVQRFYGALAQKKPYDIKVLVNEHSASAAEVLAAALQTRGGYELYGRPTYGKGVYQNQVRLQDIKGIRYALVYTEGEWFYGDNLNVSTTPLHVNLIDNSGIQSIDMPVYRGEMTVDGVYQGLSNYQAFLNIYYGLEGVNRLRTDGYFDQKTKDVVFQFNTEHELSGDTIHLLTARKIHDLYMEMLFDLTLDKELQHVIDIILNR